MKKSKQLCTPQELLNIGLDPAVVWNVDRSKTIKSTIFIVSALKNGYSNNVISTLAEYFGKEMILKSLETYKDSVSEQLFTTVLNYIKKLNRHINFDII